MRALAADSVADIARELDSSKRHAERAIYDVNDAAIQYYLYEISRFRHLPLINMNTVVPDYGEILVAADEAAEHIDQITRENYNNRGQSYAEAREHVLVLRNALRKLELATPEIEKEIQRQTIFNRRARLSLLGTATVIVIGVLGLVLRFFV